MANEGYTGDMATHPLRPSELRNYTADDAIVAFDTEGSGLHPDDGARVSTVSVAFRHNGELVSAAFPFDQGQIVGKPGIQQRSLFDDEVAAVNLSDDEWYVLLEWLQEHKLIAHNFKYDCLMMEAGTRLNPGADLLPSMYWDTMIGQWVLEPQESKGLDNTAQRLWGPEAVQGQRAMDTYLKRHPKHRSRRDLVPWEDLRPYATEDAELCLRLYEYQQEFLEEQPFHRTFVDREMAVCRMLIGMEYRGIGYDQRGSAKASAACQAAAQALTSKLPFRPTAAQASAFFFGKNGAIPHCVSPKTGKPSVGECCVRELISQGVPYAAEWAKIQKITSADAKWYTSFAEKVGDDGRLRTTFQQSGTVTMRFSSQRVNLQALPHDYRHDIPEMEGIPSPRSLFHAEPGKVLYEMDLAQAELRVATVKAGCSAMRELIESDEHDAHTETAKSLFGVAEGDPEFFEYRQVAKRCNFALLYSVGADTFNRDVEKNTGVKLGRGGAADLIERWRSLYPEFPQVNRRAETLARRRGFVKLAGGRKRWFGPHEEMHKAFNAVIQGSIAEFMKLFMLEIDSLFPNTLLLQVHDSIVVEVQEDIATGVVGQMCDIGSEMATELFKITMEMEHKRW